MSRLHEFVTRIRNCKTMAEERAEYQKEMAVIRESFAVIVSSFRKIRKACVHAMLPSSYLSICQANKLTLARWNA